LQAQRDLLVKQKQEKRAKELGEFREKTETGNKEDLHRELLEIDKRTQVKQKQKVASSGWGDDALTSSTGPSEGASVEDKRLAMYKNMRDELYKEGAKQKTEVENRKLDELNAKVAQMEAEK
jgi:hypothetical protein